MVESIYILSQRPSLRGMILNYFSKRNPIAEMIIDTKNQSLVLFSIGLFEKSMAATEIVTIPPKNAFRCCSIRLNMNDHRESTKPVLIRLKTEMCRSAERLLSEKIVSHYFAALLYTQS